jgi:hypothetical protein
MGQVPLKVLGGHAPTGSAQLISIELFSPGLPLTLGDLKLALGYDFHYRIEKLVNRVVAEGITAGLGEFLGLLFGDFRYFNFFGHISVLSQTHRGGGCSTTRLHREQRHRETLFGEPFSAHRAESALPPRPSHPRKLGLVALTATGQGVPDALSIMPGFRRKTSRILAVS